MKNYKDGIILGIISIVSSLLFTGFPVGSNPIEIFTLMFYIVGLLLLVYSGIIKKNSKKTLITTIVYLITLLTLVMIIETKLKGFTLLAIGCIPGLVIGIIGIILTKNNKEKYKTKASIILNIIGLVLSLISLLLVIPNGGFIIK